MKKVLSAVLLSLCFLVNAAKENVPSPARYESFEDGVPKSWVLQGKGSLSINEWHYKLGKKSLQWDFKAGGAIRVNNTVGNTRFRGGVNNICFATFGVWVYNETPMPGKALRFEFRKGEKSCSYFDFPLNYKGWQCGFPIYGKTWQYDRTIRRRSFSRPVPPDVDNILIKAPADSDGKVLIDCLVYNGPQYYLINFLPRKTPWKAPSFDESKYPLPQKVSDSDLKVIENIEKFLGTVKIMPNDTANKYYKMVRRNFKDLQIVEDSHGIRGVGIQLPRWHSTTLGCIELFTDNGISVDDLHWFNSDIIGSPKYGMEYDDSGKIKFSEANWDPSKKQYRGILDQSANALKSGVSQKEYDELATINVMVWKYVLDQGFNTSEGCGSYYSTTYKECIAAAFAFRDALHKSGVMKQIWDYLQYKSFPFFGTPTLSMDYFSSNAIYLYAAFLYSNDRREQLRVLRFMGDKFSREITGDYGGGGFKEDGCGYHGTGFSMDYLYGGVYRICETVKLMSASSFAISNEAYNRLKKVALCMAFYSSNGELPINMQGTYPFKFYFYGIDNILKNLALAGKNGCDRELAQAYVNLKDFMVKRNRYDSIFEDKYGIKPSLPPQKNISMPYGPLMAQRRGEWVAVARAGGVDMRDRGNHYMYHGKNGPLAILGKGGFYASGNAKAGFDWNRIDGTTCLYMPDLIDIKYCHSRKVPKGKEYLAKEMGRRIRATRNDPVIKRGNGGVSWRGVNGCFRDEFVGDKFYNDFRGIKTYFFVDGRIYALGSNISSDNKKYHVQTNLYQKVLKSKDTPSYVDGNEIKTFPVADQELDSKKAHYLVDPVGNGYFIPAGQKLFVARKSQKSRISKFKKHEDSVGEFATAWLEHGIACKDAKYSYVIMPYCDKAELAKFSVSDYEILRQDNFAHILHDRIDNFYAGIFFKGGDVSKLPYVKNVERDCQIMYRENGKKLEIAVGDPDTHRNWTDKLSFGMYGGKSELIPLKVTFAGAWKLEKPVDGVKVISTDNDKTVIEFACIHGRGFNFTLVPGK